MPDDLKTQACRALKELLEELRSADEDDEVWSIRNTAAHYKAESIITKLEFSGELK